MNECPHCELMKTQLAQRRREAQRANDLIEELRDAQATDRLIIARLETERDAYKRVVDGLLAECPRREAIHRLRMLAQDAPSDMTQKLDATADALEALDGDE